MENLGRRGFLTFLLAAGATAAAGTVIGRAEAATLPVGSDLPDMGGGEFAEAAEAVENSVDPTQAIVIRPGGRRRGWWRPRSRRRPRIVCTWRRGRRVCVRRF